MIKNTAEGTEEVYDALGTITATDGSAGGVFGYYKITADYNRFSPDYYRSTVGCTLKGKTAGGLIGELVADGIDASYSGADSSHKVDVVSTLSDATTNYGGVVGLYSNTDLKKTFSLEHINVTMKGSSATNYGGGIGNIIDRIFRPAGVVDFLDVQWFGIENSPISLFRMTRWPTFNIADSAVVICGILLIISFIVSSVKEKNAAQKKAENSSDGE